MEGWGKIAIHNTYITHTYIYITYLRQAYLLAHTRLVTHHLATPPSKLTIHTYIVH
jgi:hypothetical protein